MSSKKKKEDDSQQSNAESKESSNSPTVKAVIGWIVKTMLGGLVFILPIVVMLGIVQYVYSLLNNLIVDPLGKLLLSAVAEDKFIEFWAPLITIVGVLVFLFLMGLLFRTRLRTLMDWLLSSIPGVATIYTAIRDTAEALRGPPGLANVDTVVLVPFPHEGMRMAGYLMSKSKQASGRTLACVYIPLVLFPPSGYTAVLPEEDIVYTDWPTKDVWKLLLSGGLTLPPEIPFDSDEGSKKGTPAVDQSA